jgi:hypothetical protein
MSHDPVTQSMLSEKDRTSFQSAPSGFDPPPDIDVLNLDQYTDDALSQIMIELRVRNERVEQEMQTVRQSILGFKAELQHLISRKQFYTDIRELLLSHLKGKEQCPTNRSDTPPSQN